VCPDSVCEHAVTVCPDSVCEHAVTVCPDSACEHAVTKEISDRGKDKCVTKLLLLLR
jgi:hypothetical protein